MINLIEEEKMDKKTQKKLLLSTLQILALIVWLIVFGLHFFVPIFPLLFLADVFFFGGHSLFRWLFYHQEMWKNNLIHNNDYIKYNLLYPLAVGSCVLAYYWQDSWKIILIFLKTLEQ